MGEEKRSERHGPVTVVVQQSQSKGMTTRGLAGEAGISTETLNAIEHGRRQPQVRTLEKLARALGVEAKDLFA